MALLQDGVQKEKESPVKSGAYSKIVPELKKRDIVYQRIGAYPLGKGKMVPLEDQANKDNGDNRPSRNGKDWDVSRLTSAEVAFIWASEKGRCNMCKTLLMPGRGHNITIDHRIPRSITDSHPLTVGQCWSIENWILMCRPCNSRKRASVGMGRAIIFRYCRHSSDLNGLFCVALLGCSVCKLLAHSWRFPLQVAVWTAICGAGAARRKGQKGRQRCWNVY